jgi:putative chitinase
MNELITAELLAAIMPKSRKRDIDKYLPHFEPAFTHAQINTPERIAMFIAQIGHESGSLRYDEEIWIDSPAQLRYEPPSALATKLGNTETGDGYRFGGRGLIQLTGRYNYTYFGNALGIDLIASPDLAKEPHHSTQIACEFWQQRDCNLLADNRDLRGTTLRINGGLNNFQDRVTRYDTACRALGISTHD